MRAGRGLGRRLQAQGRRVWRWFFPERVEPPPAALRVLAAVYPALDLGAVSFHRGVPHLARLLRSEAIVIPALLARRRTRVYMEPGVWDPESVAGLGLLVHEAFHALQAQESHWGFGPLRPYLALYFAFGAANGFRYRGHPMETGAYDLAGSRRSRFETAFAGEAAVEVEAIGRAGLATASSGVRFWSGMARSLPLSSPRALALLLLPLWLLVWTGAASLAWLARLLVEGTGAVAAAVLWGAGAFVQSIELFLYIDD